MTKPTTIPSRRILSPEERTQIEEVIAARLSARHKIQDIADEVGLRNRRVREMIRANPELRKLWVSLAKGVPKIGPIGSMREALRAQSKEFQEWIGSSKPEGVSVSDFLVSIAYDAFEDEQDRVSAD
jgi:hypothetical protein